jgi:hypothetical protein
MRKKDKPVGEEEKRGAEEINATYFHSSLSLSQRNSLPRSLLRPCIFVKQAAAPSSSVQQQQAPDTLLGLCLTFWYA